MIQEGTNLVTSIKTVKQVNKIVEKNGQQDRLSSAISSESGILSMRSGSDTDHISDTATYVNRYQREESIWDIKHRLRPQLAGIENIKSSTACLSASF